MRQLFKPLVLSVVLFNFCQTHPATAQSSIGYQDAGRISELRDYRLPDWSYRVWDAEFDLKGNGLEYRESGEHRFANRFDTNLKSTFNQTRESESRYWHLHGELAGSYKRQHSGDADSEAQIRSLASNFTASGRLNQYIGESAFAGLLTARTGRIYTENLRWERMAEDEQENNIYHRNSLYEAGAGFSVGRVRNIVPVLRAERLSERLVAMGRARLSSHQIQIVATVFAQEYAYREVFDRADRHFWEDVLSPMLADEEPLTPYEIMYLTDVLNENLGNRREGFEVSARYVYNESNGNNSDREYQLRSRRPDVAFQWHRNLSLTQQISLTGRYGYHWQNASEHSRESGSARLSLAHLWNLADRYRLNSFVSTQTESEIETEARAGSVRLSSSLSVFIEDQLSLFAGAAADYAWANTREDESFGWRWNYRLGLTYHLDRGFL